MKKTIMLKKNYEFATVLRKGTYFSGKTIEAFIKRNNQNTNFLGIAISSKICKAVKRNHIKRLMRESYKNLENKINTGHSIIFLWKKKVDIKQACYQNVEKDMKKIFAEAKLFIKD